MTSEGASNVWNVPETHLLGDWFPVSTNFYSIKKVEKLIWYSNRAPVCTHKCLFDPTFIRQTDSRRSCVCIFITCHCNPESLKERSPCKIRDFVSCTFRELAHWNCYDRIAEKSVGFPVYRACPMSGEGFPWQNVQIWRPRSMYRAVFGSRGVLWLCWRIFRWGFCVVFGSSP